MVIYLSGVKAHPSVVLQFRHGCVDRSHRLVSLTVLQGERRAVHGLALGWSSALRARHRVGALDAAAKAGAQLQAPHVADHSCGVKSLL